MLNVVSIVAASPHLKHLSIWYILLKGSLSEVQIIRLSRDLGDSIFRRILDALQGLALINLDFKFP